MSGPSNNAMKLTKSAWANGRARPLQLIAVLAELPHRGYELWPQSESAGEGA